MIDYLEDHPLVYAGVLVAFAVYAVAERTIKRRRGTWVPARRRPHPYSDRVRYGSATLMVVCVVPLAIWTLVGAIDRGRAGEMITGVALLVFVGGIVWAARNVGRDVTPEEQAATRWKRPWMAWYLVAQGVLLAGATVVGTLAGVWVGNGAWWMLPFCLVAIALGALFVRWGLRMRVADLRGT